MARALRGEGIFGHLRLVPRGSRVYPDSMDEGRAILLGDLVARVLSVRSATMHLVASLEVEDWTVQSMPDASPVKWHLAHTTWFFERFVLRSLGVDPIDDSYDYLFNSYYDGVGARHPRPRRGMLTRPTASEIVAYRRAIDARLADLDGSPRLREVADALELGMNHEEQHQELLLTDVKHLFAASPLLPAFRPRRISQHASAAPPLTWHRFEGGVFEMGAPEGEFAFDNERPCHHVFETPFEMASRLVTCGEYRAFIEDGGYRRPELWLSEGWAWVQSLALSEIASSQDRALMHPSHAPLYWRKEDSSVFTLDGVRPLDDSAPVCHVSYFEADAYARWAKARLPREAEWEIAATHSRSEEIDLYGSLLEDNALHPQPAKASGLKQMFGDAWEWTASAYSPYPGFQPLAGTFGEYNGKFMVNQMVLRGGSCATPRRHIRSTYRNFFPPHAAWQFTGIRLVRDAS